MADQQQPSRVARRLVTLVVAVLVTLLVPLRFPSVATATTASATTYNASVQHSSPVAAPNLCPATTHPSAVEDKSASRVDHACTRAVFVAADTGEAATGEVVDVGHAGIHQFPGIKAGKSQFFDGEATCRTRTASPASCRRMGTPAS